MKRYKHNLSHPALLSCDMGQLIPINLIETLPGDSMQIETDALIRVTPQLKPLMHNVEVFIKHFWVPTRLLWSGFEDFITGESEVGPPTVTLTGHTQGKLYDYLGIYGAADLEVSALPFRAYNMIYNEFFIDGDLDTPVSQDQDDIQRVRWNKDYFTTARPWAQRGTAVTLPLGTAAPVRGIGVGGTFNLTDVSVKETWGEDTIYSSARDTAASGNIYIQENDGASGYPKIYADLASATGIDVISFREALAQQRFKEMRARYGNDYADFLAYLGVKSSDARLHRPEYIGGGRARLNFSEVMNTAHNGGVDPIGELAGHGIGATKSNRVRRYFPEHGYLMSMMYVRPRHMIMRTVPKKFTRFTREQYWNKELENVGAEEVLNQEVAATHNDPRGTFGFSERYASYRSEPARVAGEFSQSLGYDWHLARQVSDSAVLNSSFVECNPTKRCFAEQSNDSLWVAVYNKVVARRLVANRGDGGVKL